MNLGRRLMDDIVARSICWVPKAHSITFTTMIPRNPVPSSELHRLLHACNMHVSFQANIHTHRIEIYPFFKKNDINMGAGKTSVAGDGYNCWWLNS